MTVQAKKIKQILFFSPNEENRILQVLYFRRFVNSNENTQKLKTYYLLNVWRREKQPRYFKGELRFGKKNVLCHCTFEDRKKRIFKKYLIIPKI